jgi:hypothetical protein
MSAYQRRLSPQTREKIVMLEPNDFFENQVKQCRSQADSAPTKKDREFWLQLAHRWEKLLPSQPPKAAEVKMVRGRSPLHKRFSKSRAA